MSETKKLDGRVRFGVYRDNTGKRVVVVQRVVEYRVLTEAGTLASVNENGEFIEPRGEAGYPSNLFRQIGLYRLHNGSLAAIIAAEVKNSKELWQSIKTSNDALDVEWDEIL